MRKGILLFVCLFAWMQLSAQKKQNVYFLKNADREVKTRDSADYVRIIQEPDSGETNFVLLEFYVNGKRKTTGKVSSFDPFLVYEGIVTRLDTAGKRKEVTNYEKGRRVGVSYHYFSNGKLRKQLEHLPYIPSPNDITPPINGEGDYALNPNAKLIYLADSSGAEHVVNGSGYVKHRQMIGEVESLEEGSYKDGVKHGLWKGSEPSKGTSFVENYEYGKLIRGESIQNGANYAYTSLFEPPNFRGDIKRFYEYVSYKLKYPPYAAESNIAGVVHVRFIVGKDGRVSETAIERGIYPSLDEAAKNVVKSSPNWNPAKVRGLPVRVKYNIPIKFSLRS